MISSSPPDFAALAAWRFYGRKFLSPLAAGSSEESSVKPCSTPSSLSCLPLASNPTTWPVSTSPSGKTRKILLFGSGERCRSSQVLGSLCFPSRKRLRLVNASLQLSSIFFRPRPHFFRCGRLPNSFNSLDPKPGRIRLPALHPSRPNLYFFLSLKSLVGFVRRSELPSFSVVSNEFLRTQSRMIQDFDGMSSDKSMHARRFE